MVAYDDDEHSVSEYRRLVSSLVFLWTGLYFLVCVFLVPVRPTRYGILKKNDIIHGAERLSTGDFGVRISLNDGGGLLTRLFFLGGVGVAFKSPEVPPVRLDPWPVIIRLFWPLRTLGGVL